MSDKDSAGKDSDYNENSFNPRSIWVEDQIAKVTAANPYNSSEGKKRASDLALSDPLRRLGTHDLRWLSAKRKEKLRVWFHESSSYRNLCEVIREHWGFDVHPFTLQRYFDGIIEEELCEEVPDAIRLANTVLQKGKSNGNLLESTILLLERHAFELTLKERYGALNEPVSLICKLRQAQLLEEKHKSNRLQARGRSHPKNPSKARTALNEKVHEASPSQQDSTTILPVSPSSTVSGGQTPSASCHNSVTTELAQNQGLTKSVNDLVTSPTAADAGQGSEIVSRCGVQCIKTTIYENTFYWPVIGRFKSLDDWSVALVQNNPWLEEAPRRKRHIPKRTCYEGECPGFNLIIAEQTIFIPDPAGFILPSHWADELIRRNRPLLQQSIEADAGT